MKMKMKRRSQPITFSQLTCGIYCQLPAFFWGPGVSMSRRRCFEEDSGRTIWCKRLAGLWDLRTCVAGLDLWRSDTSGAVMRWELLV